MSYMLYVAHENKDIFDDKEMKLKEKKDQND